MLARKQITHSRRAGKRMSKKYDIEKLEAAADYRAVRNGLRGAAIGSIIFGLIAIGMGAAFMSEHAANVILLCIGVFLLVEGIWLIVAPSAKGLIIDGIALCVLGVWNIVVTIMNMSAGAGHLWGIVLGILQLVWGFKSFGRYGRFASTASQKPDAEIIKQLDDIVKSVTKANLGESSNIIELKMENKPWRSELSGDTGIFVAVAGEEVIFARRNDVSFEGYETAAPGKDNSREISVLIRTMKFEGKISPLSMERYKAWKKKG
jgi:hypothetical protein